MEISSRTLKRRRGRPSRKPACTWCDVIPKETYVLSEYGSKKTFCSQTCLLCYRKSYRKGACSNCEKPIQSPVQATFSSETKYFCSSRCCTDYEENNLGADSTRKRSAEKALVNSTMTNENDEHPSTSEYKPTLSIFDWSSYLQDTSSDAAPEYCFKQYSDPPVNKFELGMKLAAKDPRNSTSTCVATVIEKIGPRLRLRLDGSDDRNDFWRLVDSSEISVIGSSQENESMLQPPLGFRQNASSWHTFLQKTLAGASIAPSDVFVSQPSTPSGNFFKLRQKLEAVDWKNPRIIGVATVGKVKGDEIFVSFDGCNDKYGYTCTFYSRDIFPVGWCKKCDYPLEPPGRKITVMQGKRRGRPRRVLSSSTLAHENVPRQLSDMNSEETEVSSASSHETFVEDNTCTPESENQMCIDEDSTVDADTEEISNNETPCTSRQVPNIEQAGVDETVIVEQEAATSTTPADLKLPINPSEWTTENVITFVTQNSPSLTVNIMDIFRQHEIDGKAMLLLNYKTMTKYMGLKLGPALKICDLISKMKTTRRRTF